MGFVKVLEGGGVMRAITPSDTTVIHGCKALWSNAGGGVSLQWGNEDPVSVTIPAGQPLVLAGSFKVRATGTAAAVLGFFEPK